MEIRVLRYFLAVAREGSITGAAHYLHVTQPTLSRQLKELEDKLGKKLFVRKSHHMALTEEGMILRKRAEEIIEMVTKVEKEFQSMEGTISGDVYIGGGETEAMRLIAKVVRDFQLKYPKVKCHFQSGNFDDVTEMLDQGLLDFCLLIEPADLSKYHSIRLPADDVWGVVMRKDSPLAMKESIRRQDLVDLPLLLSRQAMKSGLSRNEFSEWFGEDYEKLHVVCTYNLLYNAGIMVKEGVGYAISIDKVADTSEESHLCFRPLEPKLASGVRFVWKKHQVFSQAAHLFFSEMEKQFSKHNGQGRDK
ncbi:LysR family transcriptional regulator [Bacillus sp. 179-C3.3 HS]|uniref:LysR family transcriptional regulator n=1 Tax=Bacillus sp. 179-C3.3 HS TaxID=3232162 RepID=UPI0039A3A4F8